MRFSSKQVMEFVAGLATLGLGWPLAIDAVPPNGLYGYRVAATLSNRAVWYEVNRTVGIGMVCVGALAALAATVANKRAPRSNAPICVLLGGLVICFVVGGIRTLTSASGKEVAMEGTALPIDPIHVQLYFMGLSALIIALSLPLAMNRVRPNHLYGFRVPKTLSNEQTWYQINAFSGRASVLTGVATLVIAVLLRLLDVPLGIYEWACGTVLIGGLIVVVVASSIKLRQIP